MIFGRSTIQLPPNSKADVGVLRDFLVKDWKDLELVVKDTAERNWAKGTTDELE